MGDGPGTSVKKPGVSGPTAADVMDVPRLKVGPYRSGTRRGSDYSLDAATQSTG